MNAAGTALLTNSDRRREQAHDREHECHGATANQSRPAALLASVDKMVTHDEVVLDAPSGASLDR